MAKVKPLSSCCKAGIENITSDEGTGYMECMKCKKPCDYWSEKSATLKWWKCKCPEYNNHSSGLHECERCGEKSNFEVPANSSSAQDVLEKVREFREMQKKGFMRSWRQRAEWCYDLENSFSEIAASYEALYRDAAIMQEVIKEIQGIHLEASTRPGGYVSVSSQLMCNKTFEVLSKTAFYPKPL